MDTENKTTDDYTLGSDPDHRVSVKLALEFVGARPFGMSDDEYITGIMCAVVSNVMEQAILFLDTNPAITEVKDRAALRAHIMNGATVAVTEQLCAVWKFSGQGKEKLPPFVKMMFALFEEAEASKDWESSPYAPNVGDIGHA